MSPGGHGAAAPGGVLAALVSWAADWPVLALQAALLALALALAQFLARGRGGPGIWGLLWGLVPLRLLLPARLQGPVQLLEVDPRLLAGQGGWTESPAAPGAWLVLWGTGLAVLLTLGLRRQRAQARLLRATSTPVHVGLRTELEQQARTLGLTRVPDLRIGRGGPALVGLRRPFVLLPEALAGPSATALRAHALRHELAHALRRDPLRGALWQAAALLFWWHPAVWFARARAAALAEEACDALAAGPGPEERADYRSGLLRLARLRLDPGPGLALVSPVTVLRARLRSLERPFARRSRLRYLLLPAGGLLLGLTPLAGSASGPGGAVAPPALVLDLLEQPGSLQGCLQKRYAALAWRAHLLTDPELEP